MKKLILIGALTLVSYFAYSEDIELYISDTAKQSGKRPQVLIIFDNSGSMGTDEWVKPSYNPKTNYPGIGGDNSAKNTRIYYTKGGLSGTSLPIPNASSEPRHFSFDINSCASAREILAKTGFYTGRIREYTIKGNSGAWEEIPDTTGVNIKAIDCQDDVNKVPETFSPSVDSSINKGDDLINGGTMANGYPVNGKGTKQNPIYYGTLAESEASVSWSGELVTLYTDNFLRWNHNTSMSNVKKERIDIAKESIVNVINAAPAVDFGLQIFNYNLGNKNNSANGGRIVAGIKQMTATNKSNLIDIIEDDLRALTNTPLCETLYEASRYFAGQSVYYGNDSNQVNYNYANTPPRDTSIEVSNVYQSPFGGCHSKAYVILITDGEPTQDNHADSLVNNLQEVIDNGDGTTTTNKFDGSKYSGNYLAALAGWMRNHDVNATIPNKQTIDTFPIGFSDGANSAEPLLKETAKLGNQKGLYFKATDSTQLTAALLNILENLEPSNESLTSASVAANNFDRTETLNSVYYAMFDPQHGPRWQGNLKKYKVFDDVQKGANGVAAIDDTTGYFSSYVRSYWTPANASPDGAIVEEGGVAEMLRNKTNRTIYSDIGTGNKLALLTSATAKTSFGSNAALATALDVANNQSDIDDMLNWAKGIDVDDEDEDNSTTDIRYDVFGDPLHSKPLVVNYGNDVIRIVIGTNAGMLHMFEDVNDTIDELWSFMPKEFFGNIKPLRDNFSTADKVYGIDGRISSHVQDHNGDGIINGTDKVWIFFGLRRGGSSYYAIDISTTTPKLLWHIDSSTPGFSELGQSWSQPVITYSKVNASATVAKPVVIFGGGYDINKDQAGVGTDDSVGRAIYMVDAETGALKWSLAPSGGITEFAGITDSIPSNVAHLDSNGDGLTDRLYVGDTGGNLWRVDMPDANPKDSTHPWTVFKLASVAGTTNAEDRRFFYEPSIVRAFITETIQTDIIDNGVTKTVIRQQETPYDALLIGSGDRSNPLGTDTQDTFFMIKDENIFTRSYSSTTTPATPSTIVHTNSSSDLYDLTTSVFDDASLSDADRQKEAVKLSEKKGWFINLDKSTGEKNTSSANVINNVVYFTSYTPPDNVVLACEVPGGESRLYAVDLAQGRQIYKWENDGVIDEKDRSIIIDQSFLDSPTLIVVPNDDGNPNTVDEAVGNIITGRQIIPVGFTLSTNRTHLYIQEDQ
ncbi:pilus assembly protein [Thalassotalea profundi]|uniref:Type IV pili system adhesin PilY n=1 Tax=Thalassotalea profundi TaxID=2036687 RepID=A0ABQ3IG14_9GAMM|nr:PilC/PilY family type IV pilus protein [Thalassotalea profundi]GHE79791.1 type IV pili system adhesin PilY [Thalassotalea profundi]